MFLYVCIICCSSIYQSYSLCDECELKLIRFGFINNNKIELQYPRNCWCNNLCTEKCYGIDSYILYKYELNIRKLILQFKYGERADLGIFFAKQTEYMCLPKIFIPIPSTYWREVQRGYNPAMLLCEELQKIHGGVIFDVLYKDSFVNQGKSNSEERFNNSQSIKCKDYNDIINKSVLIVDDTIASGSTIKRAIELLKPFIKNISIFAIAKT